MSLIEFLDQTRIKYQAGITEFVILDATDKKIEKLIAFCDADQDNRCFGIINGKFVVS